MGDVEHFAFSADQVGRLTGLSLRQLAYWDATDFFEPEYAPGYAYGAFSRVYSFRDVVGLYTLGLLRKKFKFSLQKLRAVGQYLRQYDDAPWSALALYVQAGDIVFRHPADPDEYASALKPGQRVFPMEMELVARHVEVRANRLRWRRNDQIGKITRKRYVVHNAAVLAGTRIPTRAVWNLHVAGYDAEAIIREYPRLRRADIEAALAYEKKRRAKAS
jgi:uncharacterized protein (DUF433 family)